MQKLDRFIKRGGGNMIPNAWDFERELHNIFTSAQREGRSYVDVRSGDLHRRVGGYPGPNHRMPTCCDVMRKNMDPTLGDRILEQPPKGNGANLVIRYMLPRR